MSMPFDAYYKWMGIPPAEQPPHYYRLLGINAFEPDRDVIEIAADQRMALLRSFHTGPNSDLSQKLLNEVAAAKVCLLKPDRRASYDEQLRRQLALAAAPTAAAVVAVPPQPPPPPVVEPATRKKPPRVAKATAAVESVATVKQAAAKRAAIVDAAIAADNAIAADAKRNQPDTPPVFSSSTAWDRAVAEACASVSSIRPIRKRRWPLSPFAFQLVLGFGAIVGIVYAGLTGFTMWQEAESRHAARAARLAPIASGAPVLRTADSNVPPANGDSPPSPNPTTLFVRRTADADSNFGGANAAVNHFGSPLVPDPKAPNNTPPDIAIAPPLASPTIGSGGAAAAIVRSPIPSEEQQRISAQVLHDSLKDDYQQAQGIAGQLALAYKLANLADQTPNDPTARYVMASESLELATKFCDIRLASGLVYGLSMYYELDSWDLRAKTLVRLAQSARDPASRAVIADAALDLVQRALSDDRGEIAFELATLAKNLANAAKNIPLREQARALGERARLMKKSPKSVEAANFMLRTVPDDPDANLIVGRYKCFVQQDWQNGLPYLAKSNDEPLCSLAQRELKPPLESAEQFSLADAWWELADQHSADQRQDPKIDSDAIALRAHAAYWYRVALPNLTGNAQTKAKERGEVR